MKLLFDENLSADHARAAREAGHDALAVVEIGQPGADAHHYQEKEVRKKIELTRP